jgi:hypothetical protein
MNTFWGSRVNNGDAKKMILTFLLKRHSLKISRDIFFKTSPCLYGTIFGPLETIKGCGVLFGKSLTSQDRLNSLYLVKVWTSLYEAKGGELYYARVPWRYT